MKKFLNFVKNNGLLILAAFWLVDFVFCFITSNPADDTARKIKSLMLSADLLWFLVLIGTYLTTKTEKHMYECIKLVDKKVDMLFDVMKETMTIIAGEDGTEESADKEEKSVGQK